MKPRSPIERMIDEATGFDPSTLPPMVTLACPVCERRKRVKAIDGETADDTVTLTCPDCVPPTPEPEQEAP